jgi:hypothetical protein
MTSPSLLGRRIHIAGSVPNDSAVATTDAVKAAREFVELLVPALMQKGATFVVPVDAEKLRSVDGLPICFDWLIWDTLAKNLAKRPGNAVNPLAVAVQHHKNENQVPADKAGLWDSLRNSDLVSIDNASHWDMNSKRMEIQATHGDVLITLGGGEGVLYLANLYHDAGKPVIPLNFKVGQPDGGSARLFTQALIRKQAPRFFQCVGSQAPHDWVNRLNFSDRHGNPDKVSTVVALLEDLIRPTVFAVRLLNPKLPEFQAVEEFFISVVQHTCEQHFRYTLKVVDGKQVNEEPRVDAEIFAKLHRASVVVTDLTASRPNCFIELGYALGRGLPTMVIAAAGTKLPFDVDSIPTHFWESNETIEVRRRKFLEYWNANIKRPPLVELEPLVP